MTFSARSRTTVRSFSRAVGATADVELDSKPIESGQDG
jgi:hypothetical protein